MKTQMIPTKIASLSCVGIIAEFPCGCGNYISTRSENGEVYVIMNLSAEDLEDLIDKGYINDGQMEAIVYKQPNNTYMSYVTDKRIPKECLTPFWIYNCDKNIVNQFVRDFHKIPTNKCLCENEKSLKWVLYNYRSSRTLSYSKCCECQKEFIKYVPGWHDVNINPDYFEGDRQFKVKFTDGTEGLLNGHYVHHDYKRHNKDAFKWYTVFTTKEVESWKYMEQED